MSVEPDWVEFDVVISDDVSRALADSDRLEAFERRTPAERRRLLQPVEATVMPETRRQRIADLLSSMPRD